MYEHDAFRSETDWVGRALEGYGRVCRGRRRPIFYHRLQVPVEIAAFSRAAMVAFGTIFRGVRGELELPRNAGGGAGRIQQEREDEDERHGSFYSGRRVTMDP